MMKSHSIEHTKYNDLQQTFPYFIELNGKKVTIKNPLTGHEMKINRLAMVSLALDGKKYNLQVSRLVQCTFSTNPDNKPCVIHKNVDKFDFSLDNLLWATRKESIAKHKPSYPEKTSKAGNRPVIQWSVTKDKEKGEKMNTFPSAKAAQHALRNNGKPKADKTHITASCQAALMDKMKNAYGYYWSYEPTELIADDEEFRKLDEIPPHPVYNDEGHKHETWYKNYGRYKAGAEGYEISNYGRVKNVKNRNILKGATVNEYRKIAMNGKFYSLTKLVAMTW
jgi:hypothetical protein